MGIIIDPKSVNPKGNQPWIFVGRTDAETPILWSLDEKSHLIGQDPDAEKDWRQEEKGVTEDEMAGWHQKPNGHEFEQTLRDSEGQGSLACCSLWGSQRVGHDWANFSLWSGFSWEIISLHHSPLFSEMKRLRGWSLLPSRKRWGGLYLKPLSSVQSLSRVLLFATPWTAALQASLSIANSQSLLKLMSIELVMPSSHLILCCPLLLLPSIFPASGSFQMNKFFANTWTKY